MALSAFYWMNKKAAPASALRSFPKIRRRQEVLLKTDHLCVLSDYAHHPTELKAYLEYVEKSFPGEQWVAFEPHRNSRTRLFKEDFIQILNQCPRAFLGEVYRAFEPEAPCLRTTLLADMPAVKPLESLLPEPFLEATTRKTISFVGAGCIDEYAHAWVRTLARLWHRNLEEQSQEQIAVCTPLKQKSTFRMGGESLFFCAPKTLDGLRTLVRLAKALGIRWFVLGGGSNMLIPPTRYDGIVFQLNAPLWQDISIDATRLYVGAGCRIGRMLSFMETHGLGGLEFLEGIPGTVGGALKMNAGTGTQGIWNCVDAIQVMHNSGEVTWVRRQDVQVHYRENLFLKDKIVLQAVLKGHASDSEAIRNLRNQLRLRRRQTQPAGISLGCFFKNTEAWSTGQLLDQLGFKNFRIGGAFVSPKHANFILNDGTATFEQVIELVTYIRNKVAQKTRCCLVPEVEILGKCWEAYL